MTIRPAVNRQRPDPQRSAKGDRHLVLTPTVVLIAV